MSVASVTNKTLQLAELVISNEKYSGATGYVASSSIFSSSVNGTSLTVPGDITCAASSNSGTDTIDTTGLTVTRNKSNGSNEFDFVAINPTTVNGMNFYVSQTEVISTTLPKLAISTSGVTVNGDLILKNSNGVATATLECLALDNVIFTESPIETTANVSATALTLNGSNNVATVTLSCADTENTLTTASPIVTTSTVQCAILYLSNPAQTFNASLQTDTTGTILYFNGNQIYP